MDPTVASITMIIVRIPNSRRNSIDVLLEHDDLVFDPRHISGSRMSRHKFRFSVNGRTLTITRIDKDGGWDSGFMLRAYLPTADIPDFTSTVYMYHGLDDEYAPKDTTKVIFHPSVTTIQECAFLGCESLERITIPDTVTRIEDHAFYGCHSLIFIRLPRTLEYIGEAAFCDCKSIEAVFLPPTVTSMVIWPSISAHHWDSASCQIQLVVSVLLSSKDIIVDYPPQSETTCQKYATVLQSMLNQFKNALIHTELNAPRRLTISKWRHCTFYAPILMLLVTVSVPIWDWLQKLLNSKTLTGWLLFSVFAGMTLISSMTGAFLLWWHGGMDACLPWP